MNIKVSVVSSLSSLCAAMLLVSAANAAEVCGCAAEGMDGAALDVAAISFSKVYEAEPLTPGWANLEGPLWIEDGLLLSHIGYSTDDNPAPADLVVYRNGELSVLQKGYGANGLTLDNNGYAVAARHVDGTVTRVINGKIIASEYEGARFNSPNDLVFSSRGDLYFTDPDWQNPKPTQADERVYRVKDNDKVYGFGAAIDKPNGVMLSADEQTLYVGGTNGLFKFVVRSNGSVIDEATPVAAASITGGVDGMSRDCAGNLYVVANGALYILDGRSEAVLASYPIANATNVAFGGKDHKTIFVTAQGPKPQLWKATSALPGLPY